MTIDQLPESELGREVRAVVAAALKRFGENDIAAMKVSDLRKIDRVLNPAPDSFRIPIERDTPAYTALRQSGIDRIKSIDEAISSGRTL